MKLSGGENDTLYFHHIFPEWRHFLKLKTFYLLILLTPCALFLDAVTRFHLPTKNKLVIIAFEFIFGMFPFVAGMSPLMGVQLIWFSKMLLLTAIVLDIVIGSIKWMFGCKKCYLIGQFFSKDVMMSMYTNVDSGYEMLNNVKWIIMLHICLAIYAFDLAAFPYEFRKTTYFGYGLMDIGIGGSVIMSGAGSAIKMVLRKQKKEYNTLSVIWHKFTRITFPLVTFGICRTMILRIVRPTIKHYAEYGRDWNFYFTMASVLTLGRILDQVLIQKKRVSRWMLMLFFIALQVFFQEVLDFRVYIMEKINNRTHFFNANREGLYSIIGYLGIYFMGSWIAELTFIRPGLTVKVDDKDQEKMEKVLITQRKKWIKIMIIMITCCVIAWCCFFYASWYKEYYRISLFQPSNLAYEELVKNFKDKQFLFFQTEKFGTAHVPLWIYKIPEVLLYIIIPSRRLVNVGFILFTLLYSASLYVAVQLVSSFKSKDTYEGCIIPLLTEYSFVFFTVANLATGFFNTIFRFFTLYEGDPIAIFIALLVYFMTAVIVSLMVIGVSRLIVKCFRKPKQKME